MYHINMPTMTRNPTTPTTIPMIIGRLLSPFDSFTSGVGVPGVEGVTPGVTPGVTGVGVKGVPGVMMELGAPGVMYLSTTP